MPRLPALSFLLALAGAGLCAPAHAQTVYKCAGAHGEASYQSTPCPGAQGQRPIALDVAPPSSPPYLPPAPGSSAPPVVAAATPPPPPPAAPVPVLYQCVRATDGKTYTSATGDPPGYYAPLGIVGVPTSLAQQYNAANRMGREPPNAAMVSSYYTWVRDRCRAMSPQEVCEALRKDWTENEHKLGRAFKSDQPPLLRREAELRAQLQGCGGP
ncbi:DUF4124 domain-containing protein [Rhodanobacter sp. PCA2]|uniref:DUF4124 domain-containing protein n=1 Tax=Rhodanobacter sp. PCA2 TaxID=2006117 RepID=UPI0015E77196|nr:DUF4124 domain-containing protein [Rhodanobacter sp. PCA2]